MFQIVHANDLRNNGMAVGDNIPDTGLLNKWLRWIDPKLRELPQKYMIEIRYHDLPEHDTFEISLSKKAATRRRLTSVLKRNSFQVQPFNAPGMGQIGIYVTL
ncbi:MAG: hypothetical protein GF334_10375 [Candidatus Altiarchaeales archaeon]|nr:hypothetical protein [Candidatus Altiarchaeales archaeon]